MQRKNVSIARNNKNEGTELEIKFSTIFLCLKKNIKHFSGRKNVNKSRHVDTVTDRMTDGKINWNYIKFFNIKFV